MPSVEFPFSTSCFNTPTDVLLTDVGDATRCEWTTIERPTGSQVVFGDDRSATGTSIEVSQDGFYRFQVCCFYDAEQDSGITTTPGSEVQDGLYCPLSLIHI